MQAIYQSEYGNTQTLLFGEIPLPKPQPKDVVIRNRWTGINPIDTKVRQGLVKPQKLSLENPLILGWSAAGTVEKIGPEASYFKVGDEVFYAGNLDRPGSYAQYTAVDYRLVAKKPSKLDFSEAASVPLVAIACWETLVEDTKIQKGDKILIYNGAGGVGSFAIQLAKYLGAQVVATASRPESIQFCKNMGADHVINHHQLKPQLEKIGITELDAIYLCYNAENIITELPEILKPLGKIFVNTAPGVMKNLDMGKMFSKRQKLSFTSVFTRPEYEADQQKQGEILTEIADLIDSGMLKHTVTRKYDWKQIAEAHELIESGKAIGKLVLKIED